MSILYFITVLVLFITVMLIKKTDKKLNFIGSIIITIIAFMSYQTILAYFLDLVKIPITLLTISIVNIIAILILWTLYYFKIKQFQKYTLKKQDVIFIIILMIVNIPILYKEFGALENFRYISTDSTMHCQAAITFSKSNFLLDSMPYWEAVNPTFMIASYVNDGLLMKALIGVIGGFNLYKIYQFTDISYYLMIGCIFYLLLTSSKRCNTNLKYFVAYIISIIFMIGYPLNSTITGFHYFTLGILEFIAILYVIKNLYEENKTITYILLFLLNTTIMLTYNLLAPIIYVAEFFYVVYSWKQKVEKIFSKKHILEILILFIIPGMIGLSFFLLPRIFGDIVLENQQQLWIDGYIYINYYSNIIIFIPFLIYYIIEKVKENKLNIELITLFSIVIFIVLLFVGLSMGYVSTYYLMKQYFILNMIVLVLFYKVICRIIDSSSTEKILAVLLVGFYSIMLIINLLFINVGAYDFTNKNENATKIFDIYNSNKAIMKLVQWYFTDDRMDAIEYIYENQLIDGQNLLYLGDYVDNFLFKMFFTYENREGIDKNNVQEHIEKWNEGKYEYLVVFLKQTYLDSYTNNLNLENSEIIFETENCVIYKWK